MADFYFECDSGFYCADNGTCVCDECSEYGKCSKCYWEKDCPLEHHCISDVYYETCYYSNMANKEKCNNECNLYNICSKGEC